MRIGIDMSPLVKEAAGIGQYIINVTKTIMESDHENDYFLFTYDTIKIPFKLKPNWKIVSYGGKKKSQKRFFTALPKLLKHYHIDTFVGTRHYLPPFNRHINYVAIVHDLIPLRMPELFTKKHEFRFKLFTAICKHQADSIIAVSNTTKEDIVRYMHVPESKIEVIYEGANPRFSPNREESSIAATMKKYHIDGNYLLCLSTVEPRKNMLRTIQAYEKYVLEKEYPYQLVIVGGSGWNNGDVYQYVKEHHLDSHVIFTGYVSDEEVRDIYQNATLFVYASLYEGFGLPILEAMQCGIPVITSNVSSMPEVAGDACILIDPYSINEMKEAMLSVLSSDEQRAQMKAAGLSQAKKFSWDVCAQKTLAHILRS